MAALKTGFHSVTPLSTSLALSTPWVVPRISPEDRVAPIGRFKVLLRTQQSFGSSKSRDQRKKTYIYFSTI